MKYISHSETETEKIAEEVLPVLGERRVVALYGPLGAGKTAFVRGLARAMGITERVTSPTFAIAHEYADGRLCHFDMYRISDPEELWQIGWDEYLASGAVLAVEWSENVEQALPKDRINVLISTGETEGERIIEVVRGE